MAFYPQGIGGGGGAGLVPSCPNFTQEFLVHFFVRIYQEFIQEFFLSEFTFLDP